MTTYCGLLGCAAACGDGPAVPDGFGGGGPGLGGITPAGCSNGLSEGPAIATVTYVSVAQRACRAIAHENGDMTPAAEARTYCRYRHRLHLA